MKKDDAIADQQDVTPEPEKPEPEKVVDNSLKFEYAQTHKVHTFECDFIARKLEVMQLMQVKNAEFIKENTDAGVADIVKTASVTI